jgi:hypothetical protein
MIAPNILVSFLPSLTIGGALIALSIMRSTDVPHRVILTNPLSYDDGYDDGYVTGFEDAKRECFAKSERFTAEEYLAAINYGAVERKEFAAGFDPGSPGDPQGDRFFGWEHK